MPVSRKLHYCGSSYSPGYTSDFLGIPIDLGYQLRDFSVSVLTWKMGLRIREILIAIPNNRTKFSLHFRFLQALQGEHPLPAGSFFVPNSKNDVSSDECPSHQQSADRFLYPPQGAHPR